MVAVSGFHALSSVRSSPMMESTAVSTLALSSETRFRGQNPERGDFGGVSRSGRFMARRAQVRQRRDPGGAEGDWASHFGLNSWARGAEEGEEGVMSVIR